MSVPWRQITEWKTKHCWLAMTPCVAARSTCWLCLSWANRIEASCLQAANDIVTTHFKFLVFLALSSSVCCMLYHDILFPRIPNSQTSNLRYRDEEEVPREISRRLRGGSRPLSRCRGPRFSRTSKTRWRSLQIISKWTLSAVYPTLVGTKAETGQLLHHGWYSSSPVRIRSQSGLFLQNIN